MSEIKIGSFEAKTKFAELLRDVKSNETTYVITKNGIPQAKLVPFKIDQLGEIADEIDAFIQYRDHKYLEYIEEKVTA